MIPTSGCGGEGGDAADGVAASTEVSANPDGREGAAAELDDAFDVRGFHDRVIADGGVTLPMLQPAIERWVDERRGGG